ncbi:MAG: hypothetical protein WC861_02620 [Candidatus Micrarchaeia archaeon]|jgi:hypothetical protein
MSSFKARRSANNGKEILGPLIHNSGEASLSFHGMFPSSEPIMRKKLNHDEYGWLSYSASVICDPQKRLTRNEAGIIQRHFGDRKPHDLLEMHSVVISLEGLSKHGIFREERRENDVSVYFEAPGLRLEIKFRADIYLEKKSIALKVNGKKVREVFPWPSQTAFSFYSRERVFKLLVKAADIVLNYHKPEIKIYGSDIVVVPAECLNRLRN